ncbi:MAG TPA: hypothetical protein P5077_04075 [bacterium]|nr:hypothetical protein [bacterium]
MSSTPKKTHPLAETDTRILERKLRKGEITREEFEKMLASLPDSGDHVELDEQKIASIIAKKD